MTNTMPMLTDEQREDLIASCKFEIESLNEEIEGFDDSDAGDYLEVLQSELMRQQIALSALVGVKSTTAEALKCCDVSNLSLGEKIIIEAAIYELNHPPVPALKLPELPPPVFKQNYAGRALSAAIQAAEWTLAETKRLNGVAE